MTLTSTPRRFSLPAPEACGRWTCACTDGRRSARRLGDDSQAPRAAQGITRAARSSTESFARAAEFLNLPLALPCVDQLAVTCYIHTHTLYSSPVFFTTDPNIH
jgi:hypothetical protein